MCGICGIVSTQTYQADIIKNMNKALIHRGPDGEGYYSDKGIDLAMRRLSVIDIDASWQPLYNEDQSLVLMLNGEIYNYIELREQLIAKGHTFKTRGDGETVVHLYEEYGVHCLKHLRGMFAFALLDKKNNLLFLARDRMGEKPLYIFSDQNSIIFSSELRSLLSSKQMPFELDPFAIDLFFHTHYIPEPYTAVKNIRKLPAAHYVVVDLESLKSTETNYWRMEDAPVITGDPVQVIKDQLHEAARMVIRSDVPIGVALSGGIDSGIVAALAAKYYPGKLQAISVGYAGRPESDERGDARKIAEHIGVQFHDIELNTEDFIDNFPAMCSNTDDPIADISAYGYYSVSKTAKQLGIPVMLQGQGGDELFWGYKWVKDNYNYVKLKQSTINREPFNFSKYYQTKFKEKTAVGYTLKSIVKGVLSYNEARLLHAKHKNEDPDIFPVYDYFKAYDWDKEYFESYYGDSIKQNKASLDPYKPYKIKQPWNRPDILLTKLISSSYLLENGMAQGDRLSMSNSVELRLPFVDYKFVETVIGLRKSYSDDDLPAKHWLKEAGKDLLPDWLFTQRKRGFEPPVQEWLSGILKRYGEQLPSGNLVSLGILNKEMAVKMSQGSYDPRPIFPSYFNALVLELWYSGVNNYLNNIK